MPGNVFIMPDSVNLCYCVIRIRWIMFGKLFNGVTIALCYDGTPVNDWCVMTIRLMFGTPINGVIIAFTSNLYYSKLRGTPDNVNSYSVNDSSLF